MLQEIRLGSTSPKPRGINSSKKPLHTNLRIACNDYTHSPIQTAEQINRIVNNALPLENEKFAISDAIGIQQNPETVQSIFKLKTNLPLVCTYPTRISGNVFKQLSNRKKYL